MRLTILLAMLAATGGDASLGVTVTVVRPVAISSAIGSDGRTVTTVDNLTGVEIRAAGATVRQTETDSAIVTGDRAGRITLTITY